MILRDVPLDASTYIYLERYVNIGSPSGFTDKYTTSPETSAKGAGQGFYLCSVQLPSSIRVRNYGVMPDFFQKWQMLVHPDMIGDGLFSACTRVNRSAVLVVPTASARTVQLLQDSHWFLKLNYKGLIGRMDRQIGVDQALSAIEVSRTIADAIAAGKLPERFALLRETFARVIELPFESSYYAWGIVAREPTPFPHTLDVAMLLPGFSLFSPDLRSPDDPTLLTQLVAYQRKPVEDFLFDELIAPVYHAYFSLLLHCGLQLEAHAQNILFAMNSNRQIVGIVARDAESVDKDLTLIAQRRLPNPFTEMAYKSLRREQYNYQIMHSFMFDFKLGEYLVYPLIQHAARMFPLDERRLAERIRAHNRAFIKYLPDDFFPRDIWYSYANVVHEHNARRPYIANPSPRYR